jgi:hypothetical protein
MRLYNTLTRREEEFAPSRGIHVVQDVAGEGRYGFLKSGVDGRIRIACGKRVEAREEIGQALQRLFRLRHRGPRELQLLPIMHAQIQIAQRRRTEAAIDDVAEVIDVAERLRHLLGARGLVVWAGVDHQVFNVNPEAGELFARRPFALRDLVFVMRKDQIDAAGVDVDRRRTEQPQRHG